MNNKALLENLKTSSSKRCRPAQLGSMATAQLLLAVAAAGCALAAVPMVPL